MPILTLKDVKYAYPDGNTAVAGVSFMVEKGQTVGLVGANGAGKSTLLMMLPGALLHTGGAIEVNGVALTKATAAQIRRAVGLVFQDADDQLFTTTVQEDVAFGPRNMGLAEQDVHRAVQQALDQCGIAHLADRAPYRLSGGERKLAAIASVLSMEPELLIMDEPSASLDPRARRGIIGLLNSLPMTKLIASHDLDLVWEVCSRVIVLKDGRVEAEGDARELLSNQELMERCGLELPLRLQREPG